MDVRVPGLRVGDYFADVVDWPLHGICMAFLGTLDDNCRADHVGGGGDVE